MKLLCPLCANNSRAVKAVTLQCLLTSTASPAAGDFEGFRFCPTSTCELLYFHSERDQQFGTDAVGPAVFQKSESPERLVCYCFDHSVADIDAEVQQTGSSDSIASITEKCRRGDDRCPETNPQGSCCLGNVRSVVKLSQAKYGKTATSGSACANPNDEESPCCASKRKTSND